MSLSRMQRAVVAASLFSALAVTAPFLSPNVRDRVRMFVLIRRLNSEDPEVRSAARQGLLAIGRPLIDEIYPEMVAGAVEDELRNKGRACSVFVGRVTARDGGQLTTTRYEHEQCLRWSALDDEAEGYGYFHASDPVLPKGVGAFFRADAHRELVVLRAVGVPTDRGLAGQFRLVVPLDDGLAPAIVEAVKKRIESLGLASVTSRSR